MGLVSAGLIDSIKNTLTGKATSQPTNVSVYITGTTQVTVEVDNSTFASPTNLVEGSSITTVTYVKVCDPDGVNDVNDSATQLVLQGPLGTTRQNTSCNLVGDIDSNCANFSCSVELWYWDEPLNWVINASGNDLGNFSRYYNDSYTFTIAQLKALVISPDTLNWTALSPGSNNVGADNDPTLVNNTGNYNGTIDVTGYDLYGTTTTTEIFASDNFTTNVTDPACSGQALANNTLVTVTDSVSNPGNLSAGSGAGQEELYYCIPLVPSLSSQQYTTDQSGSWIVAY
jgi:hypothetical protein